MDHIHVSIPSYDIVDDGLVLFNVKIDHNGELWSIKHRYNNFRALAADIKKNLPNLTIAAKFPSKSVLSLIGEATPTFLESRRLQLEDWLKAVVVHKTILARPWFRGFLRIMEKNASTLIFEQPLEEVMKRYSNPGEKIPTVIRDCINYLIANGLDEEGIFRISAKNSNLCDAKRRFNCGQSVDFSQYDDGVHVAAGTLKLFLRELPDCLLTEELYSAYVDVARMEGGDEAAIVIAMKQISRTLPTANYNLTAALINFLVTVTEHSETNKMGLRNVVTIFAPSMLRLPNALMDSPDVYKVLIYMIRNVEQIFPESQEVEQIATRTETQEDVADDATSASFTGPVREEDKYRTSEYLGSWYDEQF